MHAVSSLLALTLSSLSSVVQGSQDPQADGPIVALPASSSQQDGQGGIVPVGSGGNQRDRLADELEALRRRVTELEATREDSEGEGSASALGGQAAVGAQAGVDQGLGAFLGGVELALYGNAFARRDSKRLVDEDGNELDDRVSVRQVGIDLRAPLADKAFAVVYATLTSNPINDFEGDLEEAYVELLGLPLLPEWTEIFRFKGGRFRSGFGRSNAWRIYEIPQITRPLVVERFLGPNGFDQSGFAVHLDVPLPENHELVLTYEGLNNGDLPVSETDGEEAFADLCDLDWRGRFGERVEVLAGTSFYSGKQNGQVSRRSELLSFDGLLHVLSAREDGVGEFFLGGEWIQAELDRDGAPEDKPSGYYLWSQVALHPDWHVGLRYGSAEELTDDSLSDERFGIYVGFAESRLLRFRVGYEHTTSDVPQRDGGDAVLFELNFALGPAAREPFWRGG